MRKLLRFRYAQETFRYAPETFRYVPETFRYSRKRKSFCVPLGAPYIYNGAADQTWFDYEQY